MKIEKKLIQRKKIEQKSKTSENDNDILNFQDDAPVLPQNDETLEKNEKPEQEVKRDEEI